MAVRNAAAKLKKTQELEKKYAAFKLPAEHRDHEIFPIFNKWYAAKASPKTAAIGLKGSKDVVKNIRDRYADWLIPARAGMSN
ncbi:unnamed protein product [Phytophthora lilii]|uniref:Unnamed protein product n=1 Tax=Phytophthora lilii TaxID=2077276 RepID=A0A9W6WM07_9STRA|nr:unnamed protein product [Phytophthora lilii]